MSSIITPSMPRIKDPRKIVITLQLAYPVGFADQMEAQKWAMQQIQIPAVIGLGALESVNVTVVEPELGVSPKGGNH